LMLIVGQTCWRAWIGPKITPIAIAVLGTTDVTGDSGS
jgi:hypothetical protein